jgi:hypothetical protein
MTASAQRVLLFALFGVASGAAAAVVFELTDAGGVLFYTAPGLVFGVIFGAILWRGRIIGPVRATIYGLAAALSHGAAVFTALSIVEPLQHLLGGGDDPGMVASGVLAGAVGGGLLAGATRLLAPIRRWPLLLAAGAVLGGLLPVAVDIDALGPFIFYMLWQGGYAATLTALLPRIEKV